jgi:hypothetical protein
MNQLLLMERPLGFQANCLLFGALMGILSITTTRAGATDLERPPINYSTAVAHNVITKLQQQLDAGKANLTRDDEFGYLPSLLDELQVPKSSQMLVFSKTSLQRQRIWPRSPRALYFSDDVYVGYCRNGDVLEISAVDAQLGTVFYTLDQKSEEKPRFVRQDETCLLCHGSSQNQGFPGHLVRSVYADNEGLPILASGSYRTDQTSPFERRWGGWYVTGTHGKQTHLGNLIVREKRPPEAADNEAGQNVTDLKRLLPTSAYLTPHSDIVALMVMEHQTEMHNRITRANMQTRLALYDERELNKALNKTNEPRLELTIRRIRSACEPLVQYMLFSGETKLTDKVQGTSDFAREFEARGPRDDRKRSLRDFDLQARLFAYPCSYLIYSEAFEQLPVEAKDYVYQRLWDILTGKDSSKDFGHLSAADRKAIREILLATKKNLPSYWKDGAP